MTADGANAKLARSPPAGGAWGLTSNCHKFGINLELGQPARFGWTANQEIDCITSDTAIGLGVGAHGAGYRCLSTECSAGNVDEGGNGLLWGR